MPPKSRTGAAKKVRRKERKNIAHGHAHIRSTFNNTIVSITDPIGNVISWASSGQVGFKGSRKSTPFAAQMAAEAAARRAMEPGMRKVRSEEHTSELQSQSNLGCRLLLEKETSTCNRGSP